MEQFYEYFGFIALWLDFVIHTKNRPLICKLYPFLPKVDNRGGILDFFSATFFDLFYDKSSHPCTLVAQHEDEVKAQSDKVIAMLHDMEAKYSQEQLAEIKSLLAETSVLYAVYNFHSIQNIDK